MPAGLQLFNDKGVIMLDTTQRVPRYIVTIRETQPSGSYHDERLSTGRAVCLTTVRYYDGRLDFNMPPDEKSFVTHSGTTLNWNIIYPYDWRQLPDKNKSVIIRVWLT